MHEKIFYSNEIGYEKLNNHKLYKRKKCLQPLRCRIVMPLTAIIYFSLSNLYEIKYSYPNNGKYLDIIVEIIAFKLNSS